MDNEANDAQEYFGEFTHRVDASRRVNYPTKWLPLGPNGEVKRVEFVLTLWPKAADGPCLRGSTVQKMAELLKEINAMDSSKPEKGRLKRLIGGGSEKVEVDGQYRFVLPQAMAAAAGIEKEAILVGMMDRFEIWSPQRWAAVKQSDAAHCASDFSIME